MQIRSTVVLKIGDTGSSGYSGGCLLTGASIDTTAQSTTIYYLLQFPQHHPTLAGYVS